MVSTRKKKHQNRRQLSQLDGTSNGFIVGKSTNAVAIENEFLEHQTIDLVNSFAKSTVGEDSGSQDHVLERNFADEVRKEVDKVAMAVENWVDDPILPAMDDVEIPRVKLAVRSITGSSGRRPSSVVQNPDT